MTTEPTATVQRAIVGTLDEDLSREFTRCRAYLREFKGNGPFATMFRQSVEEAMARVAYAVFNGTPSEKAATLKELQGFRP